MFSKKYPVDLLTLAWVKYSGELETALLYDGYFDLKHKKAIDISRDVVVYIKPLTNYISIDKKELTRREALTIQDMCRKEFDDEFFDFMNTPEGKEIQNRKPCGLELKN